MQPFDLLHHLLIAHEIQLMKVVEFIQEQLHVPSLFGQNQAALLLCYGIVVHELIESAFAIGSHRTSRKLSAMRAPRLRANSPRSLLMKMRPLGGQMELLRGVSAANNFVLALVPHSS